MRARSPAGLLPLVAVSFALVGCQGGGTPTTTTASVQKWVGTVYRTSGIGLGCGSALQPDPATRFNALPAANRLYPFAGFELFKPPPCTSVRFDAYRGLVSFRLASIASLKGLVQKAELIVETRALPPDVGGSRPYLTAPPSGTACPAIFGGGGSLQRLGPAAAGSLDPYVSNAGMLTDLGTAAFPTGTTVYTFPASLTSGGATLTSVPGASSPTTMTANGAGGVRFATDVTGAVTSALNSGAGEMNWILTSVDEATPGGPPSVDGGFDCRTSYDVRLEVTHY